MTSRQLLASVLAAATAAALPAPGFAGCEARSGPTTAALVELYTSEGCSSCPPADERLRRLPQVLDSGANAIPLALHVGYWDSIGWKDPYARPAFGDRQGWLVQANRHHIRYTPQFFVNGAELRSWQSGLREQVRAVNARPALATLHVIAGMTSGGALSVRAEAQSRAGPEPAALYVAVAESGLASSVTRGENAGRTLEHDHVVREWLGPVRFDADTATVQRELALPATWHKDRLEVIAFVQNENTGDVLQAASTRQCIGK